MAKPYITDAVDSWALATEVTLQRHSLERAVKALAKTSKIEALALIRAAYKEPDGGFCTLDNARVILACIINDSSPVEG